jgi:hypothetical protein
MKLYERGKREKTSPERIVEKYIKKYAGEVGVENMYTNT